MLCHARSGYPLLLPPSVPLPSSPPSPLPWGIKNHRLQNLIDMNNILRSEVLLLCFFSYFLSFLLSCTSSFVSQLQTPTLDTSESGAAVTCTRQYYHNSHHCKKSTTPVLLDEVSDGATSQLSNLYRETGEYMAWGWWKSSDVSSIPVKINSLTNCESDTGKFAGSVQGTRKN